MINNKWIYAGAFLTGLYGTMWFLDKPIFKVIRPHLPLLEHKNNSIILTSRLHKSISDQEEHMIGDKVKRLKHSNIDDFIHHLIGFYKVSVVVKYNKLAWITKIFDKYNDNLNIQLTDEGVVFWVTHEQELDFIKNEITLSGFKFHVEKIA